MLSPVLLDAMESVAVAVIGSGLVAPIASTLKRMVTRSEHLVAVKLPSGKEVRLELDGRLSEDERSELITAAIRSAQSGDEVAVQGAIAASHAASAKARAATAG